MKAKQIITALAICFATGAGWAQEASPAPEPEQQQEPEKVLIVGQRPGPGMWKVSKDDHVLYVFGKYSPLPNKMEWRSHEVEAVLAKSQEYLAEPGAHAGVGIWGGIKLAAAIPSLWNIQKNPDGATLQEVLPPETYARWLALKEKYLPKDKDVERYRPFFAASTLFSNGIRHIGLSSKDEVGPAIGKLVKQYKVKVTPSSVELDLSGDAATMLKQFAKAKLDDAACFSATLDRLEADIDHMRTRANAWAIGDIELIRKLDFTDHEGACRAALESSLVFQARPELKEARGKSVDMWVANAEKALANNETTFAMLRMNDLLSPTGPVARLQAKGYKVEAPE